MSDYLELNKVNWDERAPLHAASRDYAAEAFASDPGYLSDVVRFDLPRLGDITGQNGVHLQCHIGTDTLSLARLGARMSGLDFSPASLEQARLLACRCGKEIGFVESDVYAADQVLPAGTFDLVYTGIGAINWLPRIDEWARVVSALLKPGGRLFMREGHPMLCAVNEAREDGLVIEYPYFERTEPMEWDDDSTYVETDARLTATRSYEWNHGLGEVVTALLRHGLQLTALEEHDSIPWEALPGRMVLDEAGEWRLDRDRWRLPLSYTLQAVKRG
ncbi:SAM-dependent methyltransferase [Metapseudomonas resinovorans]|uniref:class I SAM-dependent methyltransferase n=1 Tax=Metapseudomonas resinovorans TaxID=53412 RepID=UPI00237F2FFC|nr:class I SAM-dependent methyltransferase [Pseudomonas resinovorans]MDE3739001.1 class I SAM-dependent methyltransferase [Pseudomonas resinovorans]